MLGHFLFIRYEASMFMTPGQLLKIVGLLPDAAIFV